MPFLPRLARGFVACFRLFTTLFDGPWLTRSPRAKPARPSTVVGVESLEAVFAPNGLLAGIQAVAADLPALLAPAPEPFRPAHPEAEIGSPGTSRVFAANGPAAEEAGRRSFLPGAAGTDAARAAAGYGSAQAAQADAGAPASERFLFAKNLWDMASGQDPLVDLFPPLDLGPHGNGSSPGTEPGGGGGGLPGGTANGPGTQEDSGGAAPAAPPGASEGAPAGFALPPVGPQAHPGGMGSGSPGAGGGSLGGAAPAFQITPTPPSLPAGFGQNLPLAFEPNVGQTNAAPGDNVRYLARSPGATVFLTDSQAVFALDVPPAASGTGALPAAFRMQFSGASAAPRLVPDQQLTSRTNYFSGQGPSQWLTDVANYSRVTYQNLYPGIDLAFSGSGSGGRQIEYALTVAPGASLSAVQLTFPDATAMHVDTQGDLVVQTAVGQLVEQPPTFFQTTGASQAAVSGQYVLTGLNQVGFQAGSYNTALPLFIDPTLSFSTYLGGSNNDYAYGVAAGADGSIYVTGSTGSTNFPVQYPYSTGSSPTNAVPDAFVTRYAPGGSSVIFSTYLGGSGLDIGNAIAVDATGNIAVVGKTLSLNFPTTSGAFQTSRPSAVSGFFTELDATGDALVYSTYFGGGTVGATATAVAVDNQGYVYVAGSDGAGFPTTTGAFQTAVGGTLDNPATNVILAKFNPLPNTPLVYGTYLGGSTSDTAAGIAVDPAGDAFLTGQATSTDFPLQSAFQTTLKGTSDAFVTEFNPAGSALVYSSYLGGTGADNGNAIALDTSGDAFVTGAAASGFPVVGSTATAFQGGTSDAFVAEVAAGGTLAYSSCIGGSGADTGYGIGVDLAGNLVLTGQTASTNFPVVNALPNESSLSGTSDAFIVQMTPAAGLLTSSYLGGSGADAGTAAAVDLAGNGYFAGWTGSTNFPTAGPLQGGLAGGTDAFVSEVSFAPTPPVFTSISPDTGGSSTDHITTAQQLTLSGTAPANSTVTVYRSDAGQVGTTTANASGQFTFDYTGTTLPEGTYAFTATSTLSGKTSLASPQPFLVTVDRTAPAVTLTVPANNTSVGPQVLVTADDLTPVPDGTAVTLDVDLNNDGNFTDPGETGYASGTLTSGNARITLPNLPAEGTYPMRARLNDAAGNQGTSSIQNLQVVHQMQWQAAAVVLTSDPFDGQGQEQLGNVAISQPLHLDQGPCNCASGDASLVYNSDSI
jgi:hypothetical protein